MLPVTTVSGNFKMSPWPIAAVSSVFGKQNVKLLSHFLRNLFLQPSSPISLFSPTKYYTVFFVFNFSNTKLFGPSGWAMQSAPSSQSPSSVKPSVSCEAKSESDLSELFIQFCDTCFGFLPRFGIGRPSWPSVASKVLNTFFLRCQSHNSLCFPSAVHQFCLLWVQALDMEERLPESPSFQQSYLIVTRTVFSSTLTELLEQRVHYCHHIKQMI